MTDAEVKEAFERAGWTIREVSSEELVGEADRYAIRTDEEVLGTRPSSSCATRNSI